MEDKKFNLRKFAKENGFKCSNCKRSWENAYGEKEDQFLLYCGNNIVRLDEEICMCYEQR